MNNTTEIDTGTARNLPAASILIVITILGILGNLFVIVAVALSRHLQTTTNVFVTTLGCVDFVSCLLLPFQAYALLLDDAQNGGQYARSFLTICSAVGAITCVVNVWVFGVLVVIAYNRFILITKSSRAYRKHFSKGRIKILLVVVLAAPIVLLIVFLSARWVEFGFDGALCGVIRGRSYIIVIGVATLISIVIMVYLYLQIFLHVHNHIKRTKHTIGSHSDMKTVSNVSRAVSSDPDHCKENTERGERAKPKETFNSKMDLKVTINIFIVILGYVVCILPITVLFFLQSVDAVVMVICFVVMSMNYALNPLIYAGLHPGFRRVFHSLVTCRLSSLD